MRSEQMTVEDPALPRITMNVSPVCFSRDKLAKLWSDLPERKREQCIKDFGSLHEFIHFDTNWNMIRALLWFWDSSRRCFVINGEDCVPTIEEYQGILRCTSGAGSNIKKFKPYLPEQKIKPWRKLGQILDVEIPKYSGINEFHGINLDQLIALRDTAVEKRRHNKLGMGIAKRKNEEDEDDIKMYAFLIAVYGTMIFPDRKDIIDEGIFEFLHKHIKFRINPIVGILAETFSTLNKLKAEKHGKFRACAPLLQVWTYYRFMYGTPKREYFVVSQPIRDASKYVTEKYPHDIEAWKNFFRSPPFVNWQVAFTIGHCSPHFLRRCGKFPWIPLVGPRTIISYAPCLVMRQYGMRQEEPDISNLSEFQYEIGDYYKMTFKLGTIWGEGQVFEKKKNTTQEAVTPEYIDWYNKVKPDILINRKHIVPQKKINEEAKDRKILELEEELEALKKTNKSWSRSNQYLWKDSCETKKENDYLTAEVEKLKKDKNNIADKLKEAEQQNNMLAEDNRYLLRSRDALSDVIDDFQNKRQMLGDRRAYEKLLKENTEYHVLWEDVKIKTLEVTQDVEKVHDTVAEVMDKLHNDKTCVDWAVDRLAQANYLYKPYVEFLTKFSEQDATQR